MSRAWRLWLVLALLAGTASAKEVPYLAGRVNDLAGMIPAETRAQLETRLAALEQEKGSQVAVLTIDTLEGEPIEDYTLRVAETWKLGRGQFDDGALLLVVRDDRKMRLEVGYGLEPVLSDAVSIRILDDVIRPRFKQGDFGGGIAAGVEAIDGTVRGQDVLPPPSAGETQKMPLTARVVMFLIFALVIGTFSLTAITQSGSGAWFLYFFLIPFWLIFPMAIFASPFGLVFVIAWLIGFPILRRLLRNTDFGRQITKDHPWIISSPVAGGWSSSRGWGGGSSRGWGGGGGFSGGGGSFGGGGASSSW